MEASAFSLRNREGIAVRLMGGALVFAKEALPDGFYLKTTTPLFGAPDLSHFPGGECLVQWDTDFRVLE